MPAHASGYMHQEVQASIMNYAYDAKIGASSSSTRCGCCSVYEWSCVLVISQSPCFYGRFPWFPWILKTNACGFRLIQRFPVRLIYSLKYCLGSSKYYCKKQYAVGRLDEQCCTKTSFQIQCILIHTSKAKRTERKAAAERYLFLLLRNCWMCSFSYKASGVKYDDALHLSQGVEQETTSVVWSITLSLDYILQIVIYLIDIWRNIAEIGLQNNRNREWPKVNKCIQ